MKSKRNIIKDKINIYNYNHNRTHKILVNNFNVYYCKFIEEKENEMYL